VVVRQGICESPRVPTDFRTHKYAELHLSGLQLESLHTTSKISLPQKEGDAEN